MDAPAVGGGLVLVPTGTGPLVALDVDSGDPQWTYDPPRGVQASPAIADGTAYVGTLDGRLVALDLASGDPQWSLEVATFYGGPTAGGDAVYAAATDGTVVRTGFDGRADWRVRVDPPVHGSPVPAGGRLFVGTSDGLLYCLEAD